MRAVQVVLFSSLVLRGAFGQSVPAIQLHGSGTTNPSKFFWEAMDLFEERARVPLHMTYRAVGSGTGQLEFLGETNPDGAFTPYGHFASGDIPMSRTNYDKLVNNGGAMVHIPFGIGPVGIFHGVPLLARGGQRIKLTVCLLAKIFARLVTTWDHPEILALNPLLKVPAGTNIVVGRRLDASSSTAGTTELFKKRCPEWTLGSGASLSTWPADTTTVEGSGNMAGFVQRTTYSIGYMEAGHGHDASLPEIALMNAAGQNLTSTQADVGAAALQALAASPPVIPSDPSQDWSTVNLYDLPGNKTWPITLFSYFYLRKDLSGMDPDSAGLLKAFTQFTLSQEGQTLLESHAFTKVPRQILDYNNATLASITWPSGIRNFSFESAAVTQMGKGFQRNTLSWKRRSYSEVTREIFEQQIGTLQDTVARLDARSEVVELHGSGTTNPSKFFWETMDLFEERARTPLYMTYRGVGSGTGQTEFVGENNPLGPFTPYNHFGSGDIPMSSVNYNKLKAPMVHIPFAVGPVGIFHSVPAGASGGVPVRLTVCLLARIFARIVTTWSHPDILALNPKLKVPPGTGIRVGRRLDASSSTAGTTDLFKKRCPEWTLGSGALISTWPAATTPVEGSGGMRGFIQSNMYSIGYMEAGHGHDANLREIALTNAAGNSLTTRQADVGAAALQAVLPSNPSADWSAVNLYDLPGNKTWPITLFSYFYVQKDVSSMQPKTAALLKAFVEFTLSPEGQSKLQKHLFTALPPQILASSNETLQNIAWPSEMTPFKFETPSVTIPGGGAGADMISGKRRSYIETTVADLEQKMDELQGRLDLSTPIVELHGSGTTDPSEYFWQVMDFFEERAKRPVVMSYRGVGSGTGQVEFVGESNPAGAFKPYDHFGSGDIPMSRANYNRLAAPMVHIPFAVGAVGIFHGVPRTATGGEEVKLTVCLLAKIFARLVTTWDHPDIKALNPRLDVPAGTGIRVGRRTDISSSTLGITELFTRRCPEWTLGAGTSISTWPADTTAVEGSGGMTRFLLSTAYALGYAEAGHGHAMSLPEIALTNAAGVSLTSREADVGGTAAMALSASPPIIPTDPTADWSAVNPCDLPGAKSWPITTFLYFYVQKDLSALNAETAALLKAFIEFSMSAEGKALLQSRGFTPIPQQLTDFNNATLNGVVVWPVGMPSYTFEEDSETLPGVGAEPYTLSAKRRSFGEYDRTLCASRIEALEQQVKSLTNSLAQVQVGTPMPGGTDDEKVPPITIAAIVLACVAILFSSASVCFAMRANKTVCWAPLDSNSGGARAIGSPQL